MITLDAILAVTGGHTVGAVHESTFRSFAFDSRLVQPGELFVAVKSERGDGHDYIAEACARGATGILAQYPVELDAYEVTYVLVEDTQWALQQWGRYILREYGTEVIGVTGSTGKTTTKETVAQVLSAAFPLFKNPGNWNGRYGLPLALGWLAPEQRLAVLEMASDSRGEIAELVTMAPPRVAIVTTIQPTHLDTFGDLATIAREKSDLVRALPPEGLAFLNADDALVREMAIQTKAEIRTFGLGQESDLRATEVQVTKDGTTFTLILSPRMGQHEPQDFFTPLLGQHMLYPVLAAIGVGLHYGLTLEQIRHQLAKMEPVPGRLNPLKGLRGSLLLDDSYSASPAAMLAALDVVAALPARRRIAVLGDMEELGNYSDEGHASVGRQAARLLDRLVTKGEKARLIAQAAIRAGLTEEQVAITYTTVDAVRAATEQLDEGDIVLVKGSAESRMEQIAAQLLAVPEERTKLARQSQPWQESVSLPTERPTWLRVDLDAIAHNTRRIKELVGPQVKVMAVMKADGYGHGAVKAAQTALHNGAEWLGVACLPEAKALREAGISAPTIILGYTPAWQARQALRYDLRVTVFSEEVARALSRATIALEREARVHVKVDTGMHRLGLFPEHVVDFVKAIRELPNLIIEGIFTHFSVADALDPWHQEYTREQLARFEKVLADLERAKIHVPIVHAANSAATLRLPEAHFTMVRPGIALYGLAPSPEVPLPEDFRPALSWKTQVAQVKELCPGSYVSYGATYCAEETRRIAVIPVGYADGFRRAPSNWGNVLVRGQRAPLVGRVCMDQAMIDVTEIPGVRQGDEVVLIGAQGEALLSAEEVAERLGTIPYEVVAEILARVPRVG
ncbi:MAG: alanine racemase [Ardenticatenales bacterium]|nr:alanine racemase [Ardenticatenales bacterium]